MLDSHALNIAMTQSNEDASAVHISERLEFLRKAKLDTKEGRAALIRPGTPDEIKAQFFGKSAVYSDAFTERLRKLKDSPAIVIDANEQGGFAHPRTGDQ